MSRSNYFAVERADGQPPTIVDYAGALLMSVALLPIMIAYALLVMIGFGIVVLLILILLGKV